MMLQSLSYHTDAAHSTTASQAKVLFSRLLLLKIWYFTLCELCILPFKLHFSQDSNEVYNDPILVSYMHNNDVDVGRRPIITATQKYDTRIDAGGNSLPQNIQVSLIRPRTLQEREARPEDLVERATS